MRSFCTLLASGILSLLLLVSVLGTTGPVHAAPVLNITSVPTEPPTSVPTTPPTTVPTTPPVNNAATATPAPSATPAVVNATDTPPNRPERHAQLTIRKIADQAVAQVGDLIGFSIVVGNTGDATAHDVVVTDDLPDYLQLVDFSSTQGSTSVGGQRLTATIGDIAPQGTVLLRVRAYVLASAPDTASNTAILNTGTSSTATFEVRRPAPTPVPPTAVAPPATLVPAPPTTVAPPATAMPPVPVAPRPAARPARLPVTAEDSTSATPTRLAIGSTIGVSALLIGLWLRRRRPGTSQGR